MMTLDRPIPPVEAPVPLRSHRSPAPYLGRGTVDSLRIGLVRLESGETLPDVTVAYRHDGLGPPAPQVLVVHALTGSADAAGDWWQPIIGPGKALDTERMGVLCVNLLGSRYGTTGPVSRDPRTGRPYGRHFPEVTVRDQAAAQWAAIDALGIGELALVVGASLGGMVALEVALARPDQVGTVMPVASPVATGSMAIAWNHLQLELLDRLGADGLDLARRLAMTTYRSEHDFDARFGRRTDDDGAFSVANYLAHQGRKLVDRFDVETYRRLVQAIDGHDIGRGRGGVENALRAFTECGTRVVGVGIEGDLLYGPAQVRSLVASARAAGAAASYRGIASTKGHDAFLVEWRQVGQLLIQALAP